MLVKHAKLENNIVKRVTTFLIIILSSCLLIGFLLQAFIAYKKFNELFVESNNRIINFIAEQTSSAVRWKKVTSIKFAYQQCIQDIHNMIATIIVYDNDGNIMDRYNDPEIGNFSVPENYFNEINKFNQQNLEYNNATYSYYISAIPIIFGKDKMKIGNILVVWSKKNIYEKLFSFLGYNVLISLIILMTIYFLTSNRITKIIIQPLTKVAAIITELSRGNISIANVDYQYKDEIGKIVETIEVFRNNLIARLELEKKEEENELKEKENHKHLSESFDGTVKKVVGSLNNISEELNDISKIVNSTNRTSTDNSNNILNSSSQTADMVRGVAVACEEMNASSSEIMSQVKKSLESVSKAVDNFKSITKDALKLHKATTDIGDISEIIRSISEKIHLLSLNATIESARVGEYGKGFAVVAAEVKNLALQTSSSLEQIIDQITNIQKFTSEFVVNINYTEEEINNINRYSTMIAKAIEEQNGATKEIAFNIENSASKVDNIINDIKDIKNANDEALRTSDNLLEVTKLLALKTSELNKETNNFIDKIDN